MALATRRFDARGMMILRPPRFRHTIGRIPTITAGLLRIDDAAGITGNQSTTGALSPVWSFGPGHGTQFVLQYPLIVRDQFASFRFIGNSMIRALVLYQDYNHVPRQPLFTAT